MRGKTYATNNNDKGKNIHCHDEIHLAKKNRPVFYREKLKKMKRNISHYFMR